MTTAVMAAVLQASLMASPGGGFAAASQDSAATGRPLVVLLGADWCPGCVKMKRAILPAVAKAGAFRDVNYAYVDVDHQPELAGQLARGGSIPQLIRFSRNNDKWDRRYMIGAQNPQEVHAFITGVDPTKMEASRATPKRASLTLPLWSGLFKGR